MFSQVPATYELVNHVITLGLDIVWRRKAARVAAKADGTQWADMCTRTGEMAMYLSRLAPEGTTIYAVDFCESMMEKARQKPNAECIQFVTDDIKALPFDDESFDLMTMSFATRNVNVSREILIRSFTEYYRVLKPGGRFVKLETICRFYPAEELAGIMQQTGFEKITFKRLLFGTVAIHQARKI
jgi:demethylmenaquinone methyltransferase/2-methoxy-6-polyprenyl-1,4-benzoquinol methylase